MAKWLMRSADDVGKSLVVVGMLTITSVSIHTLATQWVFCFSSFLLLIIAVKEENTTPRLHIKNKNFLWANSFFLYSNQNWGCGRKVGPFFAVADVVFIWSKLVCSSPAAECWSIKTLQFSPFKFQFWWAWALSVKTLGRQYVITNSFLHFLCNKVV